MPTRLKRPSLRNKLAIATVLIAFQGYLGYHLVEGNFGIVSQAKFSEQLIELSQERDQLAHRVEVAQNRNSLLTTDRLDPDLLTERARHLLGFSNPNDLIVPTDSE
ncbi:FtsB family cell division protein [Maritalea porphyrae]|uniref:FtsB family cell division protein n=1 Tax=Maritalea porphyrae TaxID=880732 RepID=UPI0022AF543E|nr:septum formation initiator family protein [Maritalea porphyrae]MCZ4273069.1 septum formation initiator family protein [Maritalea porphyrae]